MRGTIASAAREALIGTARTRRTSRRILSILAVLAVASVGSLHGVASAETPGSQLWGTRYDGPPNDYDHDYDGASALGVSPDGSAVFVTGSSTGSPDENDYATIAYDAATGAKLWGTRYDGPPNDYDHDYDSANALGVSPDGSAVFVTGSSIGSDPTSDYATVAYDASSGAKLWATRYDGYAGYDDAYALAVSPDGSTVFVTGSSRGLMSYNDYATVAYDASTGAMLWIKRYDGATDSGDDDAYALGVSPDGTTVFVTGGSAGSRYYPDYVTIAYDAATGARLWGTRYDGATNVYPSDAARALGVSPDGSAVFVTGRSHGKGSSWDYVTIAYDAANGADLWIRRYNGPANGTDYADALGVSPDGSAVFVTGRSLRSRRNYDYATVAYDVSSGAKLWAKRYDGPANRSDAARALGVSPDGSAVFVTGYSHGPGTSWDYATVAYDVATGADLWATRYDGYDGDDDAYALGVSPDGSAVLVTGGSTESSGDYDYATLAYAA